MVSIIIMLQKGQGLLLETSHILLSCFLLISSRKSLIAHFLSVQASASLLSTRKCLVHFNDYNDSILAIFFQNAEIRSISSTNLIDYHEKLKVVMYRHLHMFHGFQSCDSYHLILSCSGLMILSLNSDSKCHNIFILSKFINDDYCGKLQ